MIHANVNKKKLCTEQKQNIKHENEPSDHRWPTFTFKLQFTAFINDKNVSPRHKTIFKLKIWI